MSDSNKVSEAVNRIRDLVRSMKESFAGNGRAIEMLAACCVAGEPLLLLGEPGTGKTTLAIQFFQRMGLPRGGVDGFFEKTFHPYIEPSDVYGPLDYARLTGAPSEYVRRTKGFLPAARAALLDDLFAASPDFLLTFLAILESRVYHNGPEVMYSPLHMIVATSNDLPAQQKLRALVNRLPIRVQVDEFSGAEQRAEVLAMSNRLWKQRVSERQAEGGARAARPQPPCHFADFLVCHDAIMRDLEVPPDFAKKPVIRSYAACLHALANHASRMASPNPRTQQKAYQVMRALALLRRETAEPAVAEIRVLEHIFDVPEVRQYVHDELKAQGIPEWVPFP